jgi:iron complex outermembrane receptor protein
MSGPPTGIAKNRSRQLRLVPARSLSLHTQYLPSTHCELFAALDNVLNARYATYGIRSDPTGTGAPGVAPNAVTNGPGVDNRCRSPAPPFSVDGGVRLRF